MAYIPRTSILIPNDAAQNPCYTTWNFFASIGWGMFPPQHTGNCTAFAWGRFWEIYGPQSATDNVPTLSHYNANTWWATNDGYQRGQTPQLGAVACWFNTADPDGGHVAIVEKIYPDGSYDISESGLDAFIFRYTHITNNYYGATYQFQGFIYNPYTSPDYPDEYGGASVRRRYRKNIGRWIHLIRSN